MEDPRDEFYQKRLQQLDGQWHGLDPAACSIILGLLHTHDCVHEALSQTLQKFGLSISAFNLLTILEKQENQCLPLHEIGRLMVTSRANITGLMDSLCKRGYVERTPHPSDRRTKFARLLPAGQKILDQAWPAQAQRISQLTTAFTTAESGQIVHLLGKLRQQALA